MFTRARIRLTLLYIALLALVLILFSLVFYVAIVTVLTPTFDLAPDLSNEQAAEQAYRLTIERIGVSLAVGVPVVIAVVGFLAWVLAGRTLAPIREAHLRQRRFVADASHEIRTPLAAIRATAESAMDGTDTADELRAALGIVVVSTERLTRLTNDLLLLARTDERLVANRPEPMDLSVATAEAVADIAAIAAIAAIADGATISDGATITGAATTRIGLTLAPDLLVRVDPVHVRRILANLLDNASRYGGPGVHIRVVTSGSEREAEVDVIDDGPGISAADTERIFEPFFRVDPDATSPHGTGLGLALARSLAERNGGHLTVESEPEVGTTFRLILPRFR